MECLLEGGRVGHREANRIYIYIYIHAYILAYMCGRRPPLQHQILVPTPLPPHGMVRQSCVNESTGRYGLIVLREAWMALSEKCHADA